MRAPVLTNKLLNLLRMKTDHYHICTIYRAVSTFLFISFCQLFYGQIPDDYGFGGRFLAPKEFKYGECVFCYGSETPCDSDFYVEISQSGVDNIRVVYSNSVSFIYDYKIRIPFSSRLLSKYIDNSVMSDNEPFINGLKAADYYVITDYPLSTINVYRNNRVVKSMSFKSPYKDKQEYVYSDAYYKFWRIIRNLCTINNVIYNQIGFESLFNSTFQSTDATDGMSEADSIIVNYSPNRRDTHYTFKLMPDKSFMICDSLPQHSVEVGNYMRIIVQKELQKDDSAFIRSSCALKEGMEENNLDNVECIAFQVYRNGELSKTEEFYNAMYYNGKKVLYNNTYEDFLKLVRAYVDLYQLHLE